MAENQYSRPKDAFRFNFRGVNTRDTPDSLAPGKFAAAQNIRTTGENSIRTRPGYVPLFTGGNNAITDIRGYATLATDALPRFLARDANGGVWLDNNNSVGNLAGNAGYGASMIPFRPSESPNSWMYIGAEGDYQKFSAPSNSNAVTQYKAGIAEPQVQVEACPQARQYVYFGGGNYNVGGNANNFGSVVRVADNTGTAILDPAGGSGVGRWSVQVGNNANAVYQSGMLVTIGSNLAPIIEDVIPAIPSNLSIQAIYYNNGSSGNCVIVPSQLPLGNETPGVEQLGSLRRGALVKIGGSEIVFVQGLVPGPNGSLAFTTSTAGTWGANASISGVPAVIVNGCPSSPGGQNINSNGVQANFNLPSNSTEGFGIGTLTQTLATSPFASPMFGGVFPQEDDYVHVPLMVSDPTQLLQILILFNLDSNNFTNNVFYYTVRASDFVSVLGGSQPVLDSILQAAENEIIGSLAPASSSPPAQSSTGNNQWIEVAFPISSLSRLGDDQALSLAQCNGLQLKVSTANNITVGLGDVYIGGGGQPDVGNNGAPYSYQCVPLSSLTGVRGNPTPLMRYGVPAVRQPIVVRTDQLNSSYDPQIDTWEVYRYGGTVTSYRFIGTAPINSVFTDNNFDDAATAGDTLVIDNTEPWPSIDVPWRQASGLNAYGPILTAAGSALPATMNRWLPGTIFQIGGQQAFTLRSRPIVSGNNATFEFEECIGSGAQSSVFVLEPNVARQTLPYLWGPNEQGYVFACGDTLRPGTVSWCKAFAPDAAPTAYDVELAPPSEPLLGGEVLSGVSIVASSFRWWNLYFHPGDTPLFSQVQVSIGKRLASPFGKCTDGSFLYFWATDCIARTTAQGPADDLTHDDLYNLFPHGGILGRNITRGSVTYYAPDYSRAATFRMAYREGILYALYQDSTGAPRMLIGEKAPDGTFAWSSDAYAATMTAVYAIEQPAGTLELSPSLYPAVVMGANNGAVVKMQDLTNDGGNANGAAITGFVYTPEWDGGDLRAAEQWGDQYVDVLASSNMTVTPVYQNNNVAAPTAITGNANRQFVPVSLAGGSLVNFLGLQFSWSDNFNSSNTATKLYAWQPSFVPKPETITNRFGDWQDFGQASYVRGVIIHADTFGSNKNISIRNADNNGLVTFSGGPANGTINHNGEQEIAYYFNPRFVAHMVRDEAQDVVPWRNFGFEWIKDPWPELTDLASPWMNLGAEGAKYLRAAVVPMDTNNANVTLSLVSSDGGSVTLGPFLTAPAEKTSVPVAFNTPLLGHSFQIVPNNAVRIWYEDIQWQVDPWPELLTESTPWIDCGAPGAKYIRGVVLPVDTGGNNTTLTFTSPAGVSQSFANINTPAGIKTPHPIAFTTPFVAESLQIKPTPFANNNVGASRIWWSEARWDFDAWPELIPEASAWINLGTPGAKYLRGAVIPMDTGGNNVTINFLSSDGSNVSLAANTAANVKTPVAFAFITPLIGHEFQLVPSASNSVRIWWEEVKWNYDPWPELTREASSWMDLGTPGAKYLRGCVVPMDTAGSPASLVFTSSDNGNNNSLGPFTTTTSEKTDVAFAFTTPLVGHDFQLVPQDNVRVWYEAIKWIFDPWPELISEASPWMNLGKEGAKFLRGVVLPVDTNGSAVSLTLLSSDGGSVTVGPFTTTAAEKTAVAFAFTTPLIGHDFQLVPSAPIRVWYEEIRWDTDLWPELIAEASSWMNLGAEGAKYLRGCVIPMDTNGAAVSLTFLSSDGGSVTVGPFTTTAKEKTSKPFAFTIPLIGHDFQLVPSAAIRVWYPEIRWDFQPWPELISEATGWMPVLAGGGAAFLQGLVLPIETDGAAPALSILTDTGQTIALTATVTPPANVKTGVAYSLATPVICHQIQILPTAPCRVWLDEIQWIAEPTPEQASTWTTQWTGFGTKGFKSIPRVEISWNSTASVSLTITSYDGQTPQAIGLGATGGVTKKQLLTLTFNKGTLYRFSAVSAAPFQIFLEDSDAWVADWGRSGPMALVRNLGAHFGNSARI